MFLCLTNVVSGGRLQKGRQVAKGAHTIETLLIRNIVDQQDTHSASVICGGDRSESFLTGCIPYLQLHSLAIQIDRADLKVDSYCRNERWCEAVFGEAKQTA